MSKAILCRTAASFALVIWLGSVFACGDATSYDVCTSTCQAAARCLNATPSQLQSCLVGCSNNAGTLAQQDLNENMSCQNAGARRQAGVNCESVACSQIPACLLTIPACVSR